MRRLLFSAVALVALVLPAAAAADVLISAPKARICIEGKSAIEFGVWYQSYSGGPRWFRIELYNPRGRLIGVRRGQATTTWKKWFYDPPAAPIYGGTGTSAYPVGVYRTIFYGSWGHPSTHRTRVVFCGD
jgi:hypothetical protein